MARRKRRKKQLNELQLEAIIKRQEIEAAREGPLWDRDPQKQYVRRYGWLEIIQDYVTRRRQAGVEKPIKYLTLPGPNASDIGLLWKAGMLSKDDEGTIQAAICDREYAELVVNRLRRVGNFLAYGNRYLRQELADGGELRDQFPFDVINLDLCNPFILESKKDDLSTLSWIFRLQRGQRFLLLLTTKPNPEPPARLVEVIEHNINEIPEFKEAYVERFGSLDLNKCLQDPTFFAQIVFPKVIARFGRRFGYKTDEHFVAKYTRDTAGGQYEMMAHSLEFEPLGRKKETLKYEPYFKRVPINNGEEELYIQLSPRLASRASQAYVEFIVELLKRDSIDVRAELQANPTQETELRAEADSLIEWWKNS